jgi:hypothetical protein
MAETKEIIACPVCGAEVTLEDKECPNCKAEFAPGVMEAPVDKQVTINKEMNVRLPLLSILMFVSYAAGYSNIIAANYFSLGGLINTGIMDILIAAGAVIIVASFIFAYIVSRKEKGFAPIAIGAAAAFLLLLPPLAILLKW